MFLEGLRMVFCWLLLVVALVLMSFTLREVNAGDGGLCTAFLWIV